MGKRIYNIIETSLPIVLLISTLLSNMCSGRYLESTATTTDMSNSRNVSREDTRKLKVELDIGIQNLLRSLQNLRFGPIRPRNRNRTTDNTNVDTTQNATVPFTNSSLPSGDTQLNLTVTLPPKTVRTCKTTSQKVPSSKGTTPTPVPRTVRPTRMSTRHHNHPPRKHRHRHPHSHRGHRNHIFQPVGCRRQVFHDEDSLCRTVCSRCRHNMLLRDYLLCVPHCKQNPRGRMFQVCQIVWYHHFCT